MAITISRSRLIMILVIFFTIVVAGAAVGTAIILQQRNVGPDTSKAAFDPNKCSPAQAFDEKNGVYCGNTRVGDQGTTAFCVGENRVNSAGVYCGTSKCENSEPRCDAGGFGCVTQSFCDENPTQCGGNSQAATPAQAFDGRNGVYCQTSKCSPLGQTWFCSPSGGFGCVQQSDAVCQTADTQVPPTNTPVPSDLPCGSPGANAARCTCGSTLCTDGKAGSRFACSNSQPGTCLKNGAECAAPNNGEPAVADCGNNPNAICTGITRESANIVVDSVCFSSGTGGQCSGQQALTCGGMTGYFQGDYAAYASKNVNITVEFRDQNGAPYTPTATELSQAGITVKLASQATNQIVGGRIKTGLNGAGNQGIGNAACFDASTITSGGSERNGVPLTSTSVTMTGVQCFNAPFTLFIDQTVANFDLISQSNNITCVDRSVAQGGQGTDTGTLILQKRATPTTTTPIPTTPITTSATSMTTAIPTPTVVIETATPTPTTAVGEGRFSVTARCTDGTQTFSAATQNAGISFNYYINTSQNPNPGAFAYNGQYMSSARQTPYDVTVRGLQTLAGKEQLQNTVETRSITNGQVQNIQLNYINCGNVPTYSCTNATTTSPSIVSAGQNINFTITGSSNTTGTGYNLTLSNGQTATGQNTNGNSASYNYTVPTGVTSISIAGYASQGGNNYTAPACNLNFTVASTPQPRVEIDKVATLQNATAITGSTTPNNRCVGVQPGCTSVAVVAGDVITYELLVRNTGNANITNVVVRDNLSTNPNITDAVTLPADLNSGNTPANNLRKCTGYNAATGVCTGFTTPNYAPAKAWGSTNSSAQPHMTWATIPTMVPGDVYQAQIKMRVLVSGNYRITNTLIVDTDQTNEMTDDVSHPIGTPPPSVSKVSFRVGETMPNQYYNAGDPVAFSMTVTNSSATPISGLTVVDRPQIPFTTHFDTSTFTPLSNPSGVLTNGEVVWSNVSVAANSSTVLRFSMNLRTDITAAPPSCQIAIPNNAIITAGPGVDTNNPPTQTYVIYANPRVCGESSLSLVKTVSPSAVVPGGTYTVSLRVTNNGGSSQTIYELTDYLPAGFTYEEQLRLNGTTVGNETIQVTTNANGSVVFRLQSSTGITLAPGASFSIGFAVRAPTREQCHTYINVASVTNPLGPSDEANMTVCRGLPNTGILDNLFLSIAVGLGFIAAGYVVYKTNLIDRIRLRGSKK